MLSPNKTWEGFLGGMIFTLIFAYLFSGFLSSVSAATLQPLLTAGVTVSTAYLPTSTLLGNSACDGCCHLLSFVCAQDDYVSCKPNPVFVSQTFVVPTEVNADGAWSLLAHTARRSSQVSVLLASQFQLGSMPCQCRSIPPLGTSWHPSTLPCTLRSGHSSASRAVSSSSSAVSSSSSSSS